VELIASFVGDLTGDVLLCNPFIIIVCPVVLGFSQLGKGLASLKKE
jgi:hypothetical protein